jgi:hypothetical protein
MTGPEELLKHLAKTELETAPNEALTDHLGHENTAGRSRFGQHS